MNPTVTIFGGSVVFIIGAFVAAGHLQLLNGVDPDRVRNPRRVARWAGGLYMLAGLVVMAAGVVLGWGEPDAVRTLWLDRVVYAGIATVVACHLAVVLFAQSHTKSPSGRR